MAERRVSTGLRWFFLLLFAEVALFGLIYLLRDSKTNSANEVPPGFSRVQTLNLQSLINAKGYSCPTPPALHYESRRRGVAIIATCRERDGGSHRFEIDFKGHVRPL